MVVALVGLEEEVVRAELQGVPGEPRFPKYEALLVATRGYQA